MQSNFLYSSLLGFAVGVVASGYVTLGFFGALCIFLVALAILFLGRTIFFEKRNTLVPLVCFLLFFSLAIVRVTAGNLFAERSLDQLVGERVTLAGTIVGEPDIREDSMRVALSVDTLTTKAGSAKVSGKVWVKTGLYPIFVYGDRMQAQGVLSFPHSFDSGNSTGRPFDYGAYLAKDGIFYTMDQARVSAEGHREGNVVQFVQEKLFTLKHAFIGNIAELISEPYASLLSGLLLGGKQSLGKELLDKFRMVGIIHIVVLSGYNITVVGDAIMRLFSFLPRFFGMSLGAGSIVLFALMTGGGATVVRASVMALLVILAKATGRTYDISRALFIAGFLMVLHNPHILVFDASFQLSFMATLGLITLSPILKEKLSFITDIGGFREIVSATLATQIFVLPLLLYNTGQLSLVALPVNLLILPIIPATMLFGFLAASIAFISSIVALPFAVVAHFLLWYQIWLVQVFSALPFASVAFPTLPLWVLIGLYIFGGVALWSFWSRNFSATLSHQKRDETEPF